MDDGIGDTLVSVDGIRCRRKAKSLDIALEVVALVVSGLLDEQVGGELVINEITVKAYPAAAVEARKREGVPTATRFSMTF